MDTVTDSSEFGKTLAHGIGAIVKGKKDYYILEHLVGSQYHGAGEKQEIMLDKVILGRDTDCHVRFDESFGTVSRHHAAIVRDGDNWRLVQLSKMNTTFLNGKAMQESWFLQSGDEIQLAVNGPKLIFRTPEDKSGMTLSQRLDSFRDQVIRPYRTAFIVVCCVVVLIIAGGVLGGIIIKKQKDSIARQKDNIEQLATINEDQRKQIDNLYNQLLQTNETLAATAIQADSAKQSAIRAQADVFKAKAEQIKAQKNVQDIQSQMQQLQQEMDDFYNGVLNEINNEIDNYNTEYVYPENAR